MFSFYDRNSTATRSVYNLRINELYILQSWYSFATSYNSVEITSQFSVTVGKHFFIKPVQIIILIYRRCKRFF